ncbi:anti-sigma factor family protein [Paenibacillus humicola]|uniref:anti-sigma factor family protein n=1 Tax=Paenibacillus humicola TaxID=3110540 RepID=UPI00237C1E61|nr:zf-HC2 domain-containing protein [Paenibacillus humicola]
MNCQEVMDYMQRQLDGDLDDLETEVLMTHTRHCPECRRVFERLQLLNAGLENLPKVTPSYSLVDAILPRLAELQAEGAGSGLPARTETGEEPPAARAGRAGKPARRLVSRTTLGAALGVAAAGIAAALLIVNYSGGTLRQELSGMTSTADKAASDAGAATGGAELRSADQKPILDDQAAATKQLEKNSDNTANPDGTASTKRGSDTQRSGGGDAADSGTGDGGADTERHFGPEGNSGAPSFSPNYSTSGSGGQQSASPDGSAADGPGITNGPNKPAAPPDDSAPKDGQIFSAARITRQWDSPGGRYKAAFDDSSSVLGIADNEANQITYQSEAFKGGVTAVKWSEDGRTLTFETKDENGKTVVHTVDAANGTETTQIK